MKPARNEDIPKATHEGTATLFGVTVRTFRLDDGRAVIHADDFHKLIDAMFDPELKTAQGKQE
jgi:hypothetical protein